MLSKEDNEVLTRVGAGTPMGELFRRFWLPALLSREIVQKDEAPVRLRILGEDLLAFRDSDGRIGIVEAYCSHRRAPLFFGRNEECGLRCPYHGWKFDVDGNCVDLPNALANRDTTAIRAKMAITAYATREAGGIVWVYMGPKDKEPAFPEFEWTALPDDRVHTSRWVQRSNFMQGVEGEIDTSHVSFLHKDFDKDSSALKSSGAHHTADDGAPEITLKETPYGFTYGARRKLEGRQFWRVTQWMLPMFSLIPRAPDADSIGGGRAWVPVDDDNVMTFAYGFRSDRAFTADEIAVFESGKVFPPRLTRGSIQLQQGQKIDTFLPVANAENDYLIDRAMQKTINFTGIWGANEQDRSLQESMPGGGGAAAKAVDRSREHLVASDIAIVTARRRLLKLARDLQNGIEPAPLLDGAVYKVRAISRICDDETFDAFLGNYGDYMKVPAKVQEAVHEELA